MTVCMDHAAGRLHVAGASHEPSTDTLRCELIEALKAAVAGAPHWQWQAQMLLRRIAAGEPKEPR